MCPVSMVGRSGSVCSEAVNNMSEEASDEGHQGQPRTQGTLGEIKQEHDQSRILERAGHKRENVAHFLASINREDHLGPSSDADPSGPWGRTIPPPPPTPPHTITRVSSITVNGEYILSSRHNILNAEQREALSSRGYPNIRRLPVISRRPIGHHHHHLHQQGSPGGGNFTTATRLVTLTDSQREALGSLGPRYRNVRRLKITGPRRHLPSA